MLQNIIDILEHDERLSGWQVREARRKSEQWFLNKDGMEAKRRVESLTWEIEILVTRRVKRKEASVSVTGSARFVVDEASIAGLPKHLEDALAAANLVENEAYAMTQVGGAVPRVELLDPEIVKDAGAVLEAASEQLRIAVVGQAGIRLAAAEFFVDQTRSFYLNSQGVEAVQESGLLSGECVLLAGGPQGESEVFRAFKRRRLVDCSLATMVAEAADKSRRRLSAGLPKTGTFDVVFSGEALDHFFAWVLNQASGASAYNRMTQAVVGSKLIETAPDATPLNLWHNACLPWAVGSYRVDASGTPACRRLLIEKGALKQRWMNDRYAQYLKAAATGELGTIEVEAGTFEVADLLRPESDRPLYHLTDFSYFEPNGMTGEFSGEIRFGEEISKHGTVAVKGGSVSGLSAHALAGARFSALLDTRERYSGPAYIRCQGLTLAGG